MARINTGCPFCGEKEYLKASGIYIGCQRCGAVGPYKPNEEAAIESWNLRADPASLSILDGRISRRSLAAIAGDPTPFVLAIPCTSLKTVVPPVEACLSAFRPQQQEVLQEKWLSMLSQQPATVSARNMYAGKAARLLCSLSLAYAFPLYIISTGVGLTNAEDCIPAYDLTLAHGSASCLYDKTLGRFSSRQWWAAIRAESPYCTSLSSLFHEDNGLVVLALTDDFADMLYEELEALTPEQVKRLRIIGMGQALAIPRSAQECVLTYSAAAKHLLGPGGLMDFAYRAAQHYVTERLLRSDIRGSDPGECRAWVAAAQQMTEEQLASYPSVHVEARGGVRESTVQSSPLVLGESAPRVGSASDIEVVAFITEHNLLHVAGTRGLKLLRSTGRSCSQDRFERILESLKRIAAAAIAGPEQPSTEEVVP
jgi:Lar family restriction alleviation protein